MGMNPMLLSGVVLAGANISNSGGDDGLWTAEEIAGLELQGTELVVLSACETGLGRIAEGEGVLGLRRAFMQAEAQTVVMSLWSVEDKATAALMESLYAELANGKNPIESLRLAQIEWLNDARERHGEARPDRWGAFLASEVSGR